MGFTFDHFWQGLLTVGALILGWLEYSRRQEMKRIADVAEAADKKAATARDDLAQHKLYAAENFARRAEVNEGLAAIERRLKERLDEMREAQAAENLRVTERLEEIRDRLPRRT